MRFLLWIIVFLLALSFAIKNTDNVTVRYYLGMEWNAPLVIVLLLVFCGGVIAGVAANLPYVFRLRRELGRLKRAQPAAPPTTTTSAATTGADSK